MGFQSKIVPEEILCVEDVTVRFGGFKLCIRPTPLLQAITNNSQQRRRFLTICSAQTFLASRE